MKCYFLFFVALLISACSIHPKGDFDSANIPGKPDYHDLSHWAAHPQKEDFADTIVESGIVPHQYYDAVDVFFLHPTSYTGDRGERSWNADINDKKVNQKTDEGSILYQASLFNTVGYVYAPRYRQAHYHAYFTRSKGSEARKAFNLAYEDIVEAFFFYLENWNEGKPFIIASHSQGTTHAIRLIQEHIESSPLKKHLIAAYLVGMPVPADSFQNIEACQNKDQTECYCSWRTFRRDHIPKNHNAENNLVVTNPLNWTLGEEYVDATHNIGSVIFLEKGYIPGLADAQVHEGLLWVSKPRFKGSWLLISPIYHRGDYNFFYANVRENAMNRVVNYFNQKK